MPTGSVAGSALGSELPGIPGSGGSAEGSMHPSALSQNLSAVQGGVADIHFMLRDHPTYRARFRERVTLSLQTTNIGVFGVNSTGAHRGALSFQGLADEFAGLIYCETTRWGDVAKSPGFRKSDPAYLWGQSFGDWDRNTTYLSGTWIPQRRGYFLQHLQSANLANQ